MYKYRKLSYISIVILILCIIYALVGNIQKVAPAKTLQIDFYLSVNEARDYWIGDLLSLYSKNNELISVLSKYAGVQTGILTGSDTVTLDVIDSNFADRPIRRTDLIDLGRPGDYSTYLAYSKDTLIAIASDKKIYKLDSLKNQWVDGEEIKKRSHLPLENLGKIKYRFSNEFQNSDPIFVNSRRILHGGASGFYDCKIAQDKNYSCTKVTKKGGFCDYFFAYDVSGDIVSLYCGSGNIYKYSLNTKKMMQQFSATDYGISNQIYSSFILGNAIYLGHYPSGGLLKKVASGSEGFVSPAPIGKLGTSRGRELQSISFIGGKLIAGVWPWGELWDGKLQDGLISFNSYVRLFSSGQTSNKSDHPYENYLSSNHDYNELGQRVSTIVPCWNGICISTSSKGKSLAGSDKLGDWINEYGRIYYLPGPKSSCSVELVSGYFKLIFRRDGVITLEGDKGISCKLSLAADLVENIIDKTYKISFGSSFGEINGHYGQVIGFRKE